MRERSARDHCSGRPFRLPVLAALLAVVLVIAYAAVYIRPSPAVTNQVSFTNVSAHVGLPPIFEDTIGAQWVDYDKIDAYPGAGHAFFNDTRPAYWEEAAADAWQRTLAWFKKHLVP